jgi:type I restriction enzyme S subunit
MIDGLKPYPAMKDSGVPWLGDVPEHWDIEPLGRSIRVKSGDMISSDDERESGVPIYGGNGIRGYTFKPNSHGPTVLLGRVGAKCGCVHLVNGAFWASEHALRVIPQTEIDLKFLALVLEHADLNRMAIRTAQPLINSTIVRSHRAAIPPLPEQAAIVRFLDHADRRIRRYIRAKQRLIKLLEELKATIIHRAVTGQIDVRTGQPYPRYKPSGVEWLGDVPEHWEVLTLRRVITRAVDGPQRSRWAAPLSALPRQRNPVSVSPEHQG